MPQEPPTPSRYQRMPGLFREWELGDLIVPSTDFRVELACKADDGTQLFAVYRATPQHQEQ